MSPPIDQTRLSSGVSRKSKSKESYTKNKTFEFPNNYLKSLINSNAEFKSDETKNTQYYQSIIKNHNRSSSRESK
jgi:hypothetical protein